ncbi:MAG: molybdopterin-dependent oxidoreductase [Magnetovibrio sp.]|nr:molybdopterin-dependent oxidoreductase [Magnetovibrio sp.]
MIFALKSTMFSPGLHHAFFSILVLAAVLFSPRHHALADTPSTALPKPETNIILTVKGNIQNTNNANAADFDMAMLKALPETVIRTKTPWTKGLIQFKGVKITELLKHVTANGSVGEFTALNDYTVHIPFKNMNEHGVIIAYEMNGKPISRRDKGPLWVVYPLDDEALMHGSVYHDRMVWQLRTVFVK